MLGISRSSSEETGLQEVERMSWDVVLPAFEMDCRDWTRRDAHYRWPTGEVGGAPLLAVLSTAVFDETNFQSASGVFTIGWLDDESRERSQAGVAELLDPDGPADGEPGGWTMRYLVPSPDGQLGLLASSASATTRSSRSCVGSRRSWRPSDGLSDPGCATGGLTSPTRGTGNARRPVGRCNYVNRTRQWDQDGRAARSACRPRSS